MSIKPPRLKQLCLSQLPKQHAKKKHLGIHLFSGGVAGF
jgi:hypothetical protein